jgi:DNA-binding winged helix-turn-helix (wHTH) protein
VTPLSDLPRKSGPQLIRFEDFEADLRTEELSKSGTRLRLPHQSFCVLAMLLERAGQLVTREELRARLWSGSTLIEYDQRLNAAVNRLREALLDSAEAPRFIETLPKRGYRFIAAIEPVPAPSAPAPEPSAELTGVHVPAPPELEKPTSGAGAAGASRLADNGDISPRAGRMPVRRKIFFAVLAALGAIGLIAVTITVMTARSTRLVSARQVVPFASFPGKEIAPTFSPDGSQIAFAWNEGTDAGHQFDLYVKSLGSERLLRLTHHPSIWISAAWSPDGSTIAFVRQTEEGSRPLCYSGSRRFRTKHPDRRACRRERADKLVTGWPPTCLFSLRPYRHAWDIYRFPGDCELAAPVAGARMFERG